MKHGFEAMDSCSVELETQNKNDCNMNIIAADNGL